MNLKNKIALTFSLTTLVILLVILGYTYFHSLDHSETEFNKRLLERARITAMWRLEEDELSRDIYNRILDRHLHPLENEQEYILDLDLIDSVKQFPDFLDEDFVRETAHRGEHYMRANDGSAVVGIRYLDNEGTFLVFLAAQDTLVLENLHDLRNTLIAVYLVYMLIVFAIGRSYARAAIKPLNKMMDELAQIDLSHLNERIREPRSDDEVAHLAREFNKLLDRIDTSLKMQQNFISNASHELKNPIAAIIGEVDVALSRQRTAEEYVSTLKVVEHEAARLNNLVVRLLHLAETSFTPNNLDTDEFSLDDLVAEVIRERRQVSDRELVFRIADAAAGANLSVKGNKALLKIAVSNILDNALKFSTGPVELVIDRDEELLLHIRDNGIGIPNEDIENLYIPFFRSANARALPGFGIGLPLVKRILEMHRMNIRVSSEQGKSTTFTLVFHSGAASN